MTDERSYPAVEPVQGDAPVEWTTYIAADDADAAAESVRAAGGTVTLGPVDAEPVHPADERAKPRVTGVVSARRSGWSRSLN
ncbi:MAG: hypothetical protein V7643_155 [Mycobacterium sp.]